MTKRASGHATPASWEQAREALHARGLRWTPQRRLILDVLAATTGHVTGSAVVERCRERDPETTPSTVYRTLDVLEELGYVRHSHGVDGREEYHVLPTAAHGHLQCDGCGGTWDIDADEAEGLVARLGAARGFSVDLGHLAISGRCGRCVGDADPEDTDPEDAEGAGVAEGADARGAPIAR